MHYEPTDTAAMARTSNLNEELGQVSSFLHMFNQQGDLVSSLPSVVPSDEVASPYFSLFG